MSSFWLGSIWAFTFDSITENSINIKERAHIAVNCRGIKIAVI